MELKQPDPYAMMDQIPSSVWVDWIAYWRVREQEQEREQKKAAQQRSTKNRAAKMPRSRSG